MQLYIHHTQLNPPSRSPAMHGVRCSMLQAAVMHEDIDSLNMELPPDRQMVGVLRRAAHMYNAQFSWQALDASGLWPLQCLKLLQRCLEIQTQEAGMQAQCSVGGLMYPLLLEYCT